MVYKYDFLIIGAGVAGMSYALKVARAGRKVCIICKTSLDEANTSFAQGGVASVTNLELDNFQKHIDDTMVAGDYISDPQAVEQVVRMAPEQIKELVQWGVNFDRKEDGSFDLHREGGHSEFRILHHADDTGAEIQRGLMEAVRNNPNITVKENHFAVEIITQHHLGVRVTRRSPHIQCYGAYVLAPDTEKVDTYLSKVTIMCTGGCGAVYLTTSNPVIATGDGIAMVYRAKGTVADMEFVQFHPTVLHNPQETHPAYLITEAMRGYGGILKLPSGETFMEKYDERLSLAPRDIVARAIDKEMKIHGLDHVCLDVTHKDAAETRHHFPNIYQKCLSIGIDITTDYIPVRPAAQHRASLCPRRVFVYGSARWQPPGVELAHRGRRLCRDCRPRLLAARRPLRLQRARARVERRGHDDQRGEGAHHAECTRGEPDYGQLCWYCSQRPAPAPCLGPSGHALRRDGAPVQARESQPRHLRTA